MLKSSRRSVRNALISLIRGVTVAGLVSMAGAGALSAQANGKLNPIIKIVAGENFYGDVAAQLGGKQVSVTSIMSDPDVDPHEYESNVSDAKAIAQADLIVEAGGGYDDWLDKLAGASPRAGRILVQGFAVAPNKLPENEHVWYDPNNVARIAESITAALKKLDPAHSQDFDRNLAAFRAEVQRITGLISQIKAKFAGTPIGLTETIFLYQSGPLGLSVLTPFAFQKAIAEGEDPPVDSVVAAESQVTGKKIKVLVYNAQTANDITEKLKSEAKAAGIPIVPVTETMPEGTHYQNWMLGQLNALQSALSARQ